MPDASPERPSSRVGPPVREHRHRDVQGGVARAAVFGASDGLVTNMSLMLGVAGAELSNSVVRITGIAGLVAGAVSMAFGEYGSMKAQTELFERELDLERGELARSPHVEEVELAQLYQARGVDPDTARAMASEMMADPDRALEAHAREELGIDPGSLGSPVGAAASSLAAFAIGALVPLVPWFVLSGTAAVITSLVFGLLGALAIGITLARFTKRRTFRTIARPVVLTAVAAALTFAIGRAIGVATT